MHLIAYISDILIPPQELDIQIKNIIQTAKRRNAEHNITGVLFSFEGKFLQIIEGKESDLRELMQDIKADKRHNTITYLIDTQVESRGFRDWNMESFQLDQDVTFNADTMKKITASFKQNLLPRSDMLFFYYKALLRQKTA